MQFLKNIKANLILIAVIVVAILLLLNDFLIYGLTVLLASFLIYWLWNRFIRSKDEEIDQLKTKLEESDQEINKLSEENEELKHRKLNISELRNILDLGLMEINTNFTRTWNEKLDHKNKNFHFVGALQVKVRAKYGLDLKELRLKSDNENNILYIGNINPKFLSFSDLDYEWKIAEIMEYKQPWLGTKHWRKSDALLGAIGEIKEGLRTKTHQEIKQGPEELKWLIGPLEKQIRHTLETMLSAQGRTIRFADSIDQDFKSLEEYAGRKLG